jgi:hypothetical protein
MDKTNLSLILSALGLAVELGADPIATAILAAFTAGLYTGKTTRPRP